MLLKEEKSMKRKITVRGYGTECIYPDQIEVRIGLESHKQSYEETIACAQEQVAQLSSELMRCGFTREDLKTEKLNVETAYESRRGEDGSFRRYMDGYICSHFLLLQFSKDMELLGKVIEVIAQSPAEPDYSIRFTFKDRNAAAEMLLKEAARDARERAEILCKASGVKLGRLIRIDHNQGEPDVYSTTEYSNDAVLAPAVIKKSALTDMKPEEIRLTGTATFIWEIID